MKRWFLQQPQGVTSQKTAFLTVIAVKTLHITTYFTDYMHTIYPRPLLLHNHWFSTNIKFKNKPNPENKNPTLQNMSLLCNTHSASLRHINNQYRNTWICPFNVLYQYINDTFSYLIDNALIIFSCGQDSTTLSTTRAGHRHKSKRDRPVAWTIAEQNSSHMEWVSSFGTSILRKSRCCVSCLCRLFTRPSQSPTCEFFILTVRH
jgi:hypothetical protein